MLIDIRLTPSALIIYKTLRKKNQRMRKNEIISRTGYSGRSFHYAVKQLIELNLIKITPDIEDTRKSFYSILKVVK